MARFARSACVSACVIMNQFVSAFVTGSRSRLCVETDSISYLVAHLLRSDSLSYQPRRLLAGGLAALNIEDAPGALGQFKVVAAHRKDKPLSRGAELLLQQFSV